MNDPIRPLPSSLSDDRAQTTVLQRDAASAPSQGKPSPNEPSQREQESGKVGMALLLWMLGVPGSLVLLYLLFAH